MNQTTNQTEFVEWVSKIDEEVNYVQNLLTEKLSDEPEKLVKDLEAVEVWNARMGSLLADANSYLDKSKFHMLPGKEGRTEFERKTELDYLIESERNVRDRIESICGAIKQRLILGESILSYYKQFKDIKFVKNIEDEKIY